MGDYKLANMAQETIKITKKGYYHIEDKKVNLVHNSVNEDFSNVIVLDENKLKSIIEDEDEFFDRSFCGSEGAKMYLVDADSYQAAEPFKNNVLVMNFANALHIGGGFLNGARAQEEALCRNSTLYASISSKEGRKMYNYNSKHFNPLDSDYMLISPDVCVFRDVNGKLLAEPYNVSVVTIPAPNKRGRAKDIPQSTLDEIMTDRLSKMLLAAARHGYRNLVLGAWGCGAFGHSAKRVAGYFKKLFYEDGFNEFFDNVVFAIFHDKDKIEAFKEVFGDKVDYVNDVREIY